MKESLPMILKAVYDTYLQQYCKQQHVLLTIIWFIILCDNYKFSNRELMRISLKNKNHQKSYISAFLICETSFFK